MEDALAGEKGTTSVGMPNMAAWANVPALKAVAKIRNSDSPVEKISLFITTSLSAAFSGRFNQMRQRKILALIPVCIIPLLSIYFCKERLCHRIQNVVRVLEQAHLTKITNKRD
jgi:hypothetical protein